MKKEHVAIRKDLLIGIVIAVAAVVIILGFVVLSGRPAAPSPETGQPGIIEKSNISITISGVGQKQAIDKPNNNVILVVSGAANNVSVSKNTMLLRLVVTGEDNAISLCKDIHQPELIQTNPDNTISYLVC